MASSQPPPIRLLEAKCGYTYHPDGLRRTKIVGSTTHRYHYDGSQLVRITDTNGRTVWAFTWNAGKLVQVTNAAGESFETVTNHRGDVVRLLDKAGNTVAEYDYDPWGNLVSPEPTDSRVKGQPVRYAGYVYDTETRLYYLQARYYDPATARFVSRDPDPGDEDDPVTMNGYTYADGNPVMNTDPDGHWAWAVVNAGFAVYDGYKAYKAGKSKKQIAWAAASSFIGIGKIKKAGKLVNSISISSQRKKAGKEAWKQERELIIKTGKGTRNWSNKRKAEIVKSGKARGMIGHHINNVKHHPRLAGNPNNIRFVTKNEHYRLHNNGK